jgi:hypothetical protein
VKKAKKKPRRYIFKGWLKLFKAGVGLEIKKFCLLIRILMA